ncbi:MAG: protein kinase [Pirellulales bacterium]
MSDTHALPTDVAQAQPPVIPDVDLVRRIGRGGFGEVWLGINRATGGLKAVKIIPLRGHAADPAGREIVSLAQLEAQRVARHPNLLDIQHVGRTADVLFYLMDPADDVSGRPATNEQDYRPATLALRLEQGPLPADECLRCARQLAAGLAHLHAAGMVHRDVKPSNCLFVGRDLKLADFGLLMPASAQLSRLGTVRYMPPDGRMDLRADVYAAGLVLYEMLTGLPAEAFPRLGERAREICTDPVLAHLNRVALKAASRDHHARHAHAGELLAALSAPPALPRRGRGIRWAAAGVAAAGIAVAVATLTREAGSTGERPVEAPGVAVNFVSDTFEAEVLVDGVVLRDTAGQPLTTPCTATGILPGPHRVAFRHPQRGRLDAGVIDFATTREIVARW